jgi:hypothetical protein
MIHQLYYLIQKMKANKVKLKGYRLKHRDLKNNDVFEGPFFRFEKLCELWKERGNIEYKGKLDYYVVEEYSSNRYAEDLFIEHKNKS